MRFASPPPPSIAKTSRSIRAGFSLIELLVVIGVIAIMIALLLPVLGRVRESARQVQCASQLRQLGIGFLNYAANNSGHIPPWSSWQVRGGDGTGEDSPGPGWMEILERYYANPWSRVYDCPSFPEGVPMNYFLSSRWASLNGGEGMQLTDIRLSSEFVLSADANNIALYPPTFGDSSNSQDDCDKDDALGPCLTFAPTPGTFSPHRAGNNVLFADGHVAPFKKFDPHSMTFDPHNRGLDWNDVK